MELPQPKHRALRVLLEEPAHRAAQKMVVFRSLITRYSSKHPLATPLPTRETAQIALTSLIHSTQQVSPIVDVKVECPPQEPRQEQSTVSPHQFSFELLPLSQQSR